MKIIPHRPDLPVQYAAQELARCLGTMTGHTPPVAAQPTADEPTVHLGLFDDFPGRVEPLPVPDPHWDDAYVVQSADGDLIIAGSNPRSVLQGAYRWLRELGACWLWPGPEGETLPRLAPPSLQGWSLRHRPPLRHRAECIEGAPALEHELDYVEWLPRVGMNTYMLQFVHAGHFWRRWYGHEKNPTWAERRALTTEECLVMDEKLIAAVQQRGLLLHRVGHGWTAAAMGLPADGGWAPYTGEVPPEAYALMAEVKGRRELWGGVPINTELCYSQPEARERFCAAVLDYAVAHPQVDALHVWLSDASNNACECEGCRQLSPSDWYMRLLQELSPRLREVAPAMKLVFLAYFNTLWPPQQVPFDPACDNLVFMFAPITRCYQHRIADAGCGEPLLQTPPKRNRLELPSQNLGNVQLLRKWQDYGAFDSFAFDYHFCTGWRYDLLECDVSDLLRDDLQDYVQLGLAGLMHCGSQRAFYPLIWPKYASALMMSGEPARLEQWNEHLGAAYGAGAAVADAFLRGVAERRITPPHGRHWWQVVTPEQAAETLGWLAGQASSLREAAGAALEDPPRLAWAGLVHAHRWITLNWQAGQAWAGDDREGFLARVDEAEAFVQRTEADIARLLDGWFYLGGLERMRQAAQEE